MHALQRVLPLLLVGCYRATIEPACTVACDESALCPDGQTCGADFMCYANGTQECSALVRGSYGRQVVANASNGTPVESDLLYSADQLDVRAVLDDSGVVPTVTFANDSFSFSRATADEAYSLSVRAQIDSSLFTEVQGATDGVALWTPYYGRTNRTPVTHATPIVVAVTGPPEPTRAYIASTGLRSFSFVGASNMVDTQNFMFDWNTATSLYGAQSLLSASEGDVLWYAGFTAMTPSMNTVDDYYAVTSVYSKMVTLANGVATTFGGTATAMPQDHCVMLTLPRADEIARVQAASPFTTATVASGWNVTSVPFERYGPSAGIPIVIQANATVQNQNIKVTYANPYPEDQLAMQTASFKRTATRTGAASGVTLSYGTTQVYQVPTAPPTACAAIAMTANIAMPSPLTLGGVTLDTDNQTVAIDRSGADVMLEFAPTAGNADDWMTNLYEITVVGTSTTMTEIRLYSTLTPSVMIDPALLVVGHSYLFESYARVGYPSAGTRDYKPIAYPFGTGVAYSSIFTVGS